VHEHGHAHSHAHSSNAASLPKSADIRKMLVDAPSEWIPVWVRDTAIEAFTTLAKAEATVHGAESMEFIFMKSERSIRLSILLLVHCSLTAWASRLSVAAVSARRYRQTDHGILPVPAPATLSSHGGHAGDTGTTWTHRRTGDSTAAALLRVLTANGGTTPMAGSLPLRCVELGWCGNQRLHKHPNILRLLLGDTLIFRHHLLASQRLLKMTPNLLIL
jgi:uncharacterized protein (DUF111 family)